MNLSDAVRELGLVCLTPELEQSAVEVRGGYVSDLLSDVLGNAPHGGVLVTVQVHLNVIAVAVHAEQAAVIFAMNRIPEESVIQRAIEERILLYATKSPAFEVVGRLYALGLRGPAA